MLWWKQFRGIFRKIRIDFGGYRKKAVLKGAAFLREETKSCNPTSFKGRVKVAKSSSLCYTCVMET
ncbi:hypothetical protein D3Z55_02320 [Clostridiaceae bacterium]|nr:hypothetical protein [Clostridiaceae bacterium]